MDAERLQSIHDLASARLRNGPLDSNVESDLTEIARMASRGRVPSLPYTEGMGEESRRLHREYRSLVAAQMRGDENGDAVVKLTDECAAKGIVLVPGGENL